MNQNTKDGLIDLNRKDLFPLVYEYEGLEDVVCNAIAAIEVDHATATPEARPALKDHWELIREIILALPAGEKALMKARLEYQLASLNSSLSSTFGEQIQRSAKAIEWFNREVSTLLG